MPPMKRPDANQKPPQDLRAIFKQYQKIPIGALEKDPDVIDFTRRSLSTHVNSMHVVRNIASPALLDNSTELTTNTSDTTVRSFVEVFEHCDFPGGPFNIIYSILFSYIE